MKRIVLMALAFCLFRREARADEHHPDTINCSAQLTLGQVVPTVVDWASPGGTSISVSPPFASGSTNPGCAGYKFVQVSGLYKTLTITPTYGGPNVTTSAFDCSHTTVDYSVYNRTPSGSYYRVGGGLLFGELRNGVCVHGASVFPSSGSSSVSMGPFALRPVIAVYSWTHNDTNIGHPGNLCANINCYWPTQLTISGRSSATWKNDFDGDGKSDNVVWRPSNGNWYSGPPGGAAFPLVQWGASTDVPVPGDYDGDHKTDRAVWRPSDGKWLALRSSTGTSLTKQLGQSGDVPVPGDYDGDGKTDAAVWRSSETKWLVNSSSSGLSFTRQLGQSGDVPVSADYDGDGATDIALWRPSDGTWRVIRTSTGATITQQWGQPGDVPAPGDFDGDGKSDFTVWRPSSGTWFVIPSNGAGWFPQQWGQAGDIPTAGDFDGDGRTDFAIWRPGAAGLFAIITSTDGVGRGWNFGTTGDIPPYKP